MIYHVVMWRLGDEAKRTEFLRINDKLQQNVQAMRATIPGLLRLAMGLNRTRVPDASDLLLYSEFESWDALKCYEVHPLHDELRGIISPLRVERRVVDFETDD
jgi:Stress responsive A/B Barrel Domain